MNTSASDVTSLLSQIDLLQKEIEAVRPLSGEAAKRLEQKIRLDWTYHSNAIEGNQLSLGETRTLILYGLTAKGKPFKDHTDIQGHNEAVKLMEDIVREKRPMTEAFIRELHQVLLKEPYEMPAQSPEGIPTRRRIEIGAYKSQPNHVLLPSGETFFFASPEETPAKMQDLMNEYRESIAQKSFHPLLIAGKFHYDFVRIHPFDDGNGRMSRILMNLILMQSGFPPLIIRKEDRETDYLPALQEADAGNLEPFFLYLGERLLAAQQLLLKAAKGESLDDPDDVDKRIALLKQQIDEKDQNQVKLKRSTDTVKKIVQDSIFPLVLAIWEKIPKLEEMFLESDFSVYFHGNTNPGFSKSRLQQKSFHQAFWDEFRRAGEIYEIKLSIQLAGFKHSRNPFKIFGNLEIRLDEFIFRAGEGNDKYFKKLYNEQLSKEEIQQITQRVITPMLDQIDNQLKRDKS